MHDKFSERFWSKSSQQIISEKDYPITGRYFVHWAKYDNLFMRYMKLVD